MGDKIPKTGSRSTSAHGSLYLIAIQVVSRILTFLANQVLLAHITVDTLGLASQFELYSITALFFSRESIRLAAQRQSEEPKKPTQIPDSSKKEEHKISQDGVSTSVDQAAQTGVNISYLGVILGLPILYCLGEFYQSFGLRGERNEPFVKSGFHIIQVATILELLAEPCFAVVQQKLLYKKRAAIEMASALVRGLLSCGSALYMVRRGENPGVLPFALGSLGYSACLLCGYLIAVSSMTKIHGFTLYPVRITHGDRGSFLSNYIPSQLLSLTANIYLQSIVKHILSQGDSMILMAFSTLEAQGQYALASNYGGLIARVVFQPIEENSRHIFSRLLSSSNKQQKRHKGEKDSDNPVSTAKSQLCDILHGYGLFSLFVCVGGPIAACFATKYVLGSQWGTLEMRTLLSSYCYYIPFLAFNGITEAFVASAASSAELRLQTRYMGIFSVIFGSTAYLLLRGNSWGVYGLLLPNAFNMLLRILWSYWFIAKYFKGRNIDFSIGDTLPSIGACIAGAVGCFTTRLVHFPAQVNIEDVLKGAATAACFAVTILYLERDFLKHIIRLYLGL